MTIDVKQLILDLQSAATGAVSRDISTLGGFSQEQLEAIARQAATVAAGIVDGSIPPDLHSYFLNSLQELTRSFVNVLDGLTVVTAEKAWNAMVGVLWGAISKVTGVALGGVV